MADSSYMLGLNRDEIIVNGVKTIQITQEAYITELYDPYIFGTAGASGFHWCFVRLQQSSFRLFIARSIISTLTVSPYGGLK